MTRVRGSIETRRPVGDVVDVVADQCNEMSDYTGFDRPHRLASRSLITGSVVEGDTWERDVKVSRPARFGGPLSGWIGQREERSICTGLQRHLEGTEGAA